MPLSVVAPNFVVGLQFSCNADFTGENAKAEAKCRVTKQRTMKNAAAADLDKIFDAVILFTSLLSIG